MGLVMTRTPDDVLVQKADLGPLTKIADGGQAKVYLVNDFRLPGADGPLVFKQYLKSTLRKHGVAIRNGMPQLILFPDSLSEADQKRLANRTVWPKALVLQGNQAVGILMRVIPDAFFFDIIKPHGKERKLLDLSQFYRTHREKLQYGVPVLSEKDKIRVVVHMIRTIEFFHRNRLVMGDFSCTNVVLSHPDKLSGADRGRVFPKFLDIDGYRFSGERPPFDQLNTPGWYPPEIRAAEERVRQLTSDNASLSDMATANAHTKNLNARTDVFKFGLATLRLFHTSEDSNLVYISPEADGRITTLIGAKRAKVLLASVEEDPVNRPTMTEILKQFET
jgi:serine/threonine protein kinase